MDIFTLDILAANSIDKHSANPRNANFVGEYEEYPKVPAWPDMDDVRMMFPPTCAELVMYGKNALTIWTDPR